MRKYIDRKLFLILLGYMTAYHVVYISRRVILKFINHEAYANVDWWLIAFEPILANFSTVPPVIILVLMATKIMINRNVKWIYVFATHFTLFLLYTMLITTVGGIYLYFVQDLNIFKMGFFVQALFDSNLNFLAYVGFVTIIYSYYYIQKAARIETQKAKLSQQLQNVKMQALKSQLNPHFLFNTLNSISSLIKEDTHKAQHMIGNLGGLLREVLLVKEENMITIGNEMTILNKYVEIMQTRFSDHLLIEIVIEKKTEDALIPSMLLQPIIENSFKHGYSYDLTDLRVNLSIYKVNKWLIIQIQNNGMPISLTDNDSGFGIRNIQERLETQFGDNFVFSFSNLENSLGVQTKIKIPFVLA